MVLLFGHRLDGIHIHTKGVAKTFILPSAARSSAIGGAAKISQVAPSVQHLCIYKAESAAGQAPLTYISTS